MADKPAPVLFGSLEGQAVRFTDLEAWIYAQGQWRELHPAEANFNATLLDEDTFKTMYPNIHALPKRAFPGNQ